ncbi:MAG TPA: YihY/virulence factor BrkB family protein [Azospirillaceae bacterium]|nr:YihY/virulence factor BrkB family protein [Azospirillaceae bacterium]
MGVARRAWAVLADAGTGWFNDGAMSMAASIAFYTTFSLAPIMILVTAVAGLVLGQEAAHGALADQIRGLVGGEAAEAVQAVVASARDKETGTAAGIIGIVTILIGATTVFAELQASLDRVWKAEPPPESTLTWLVKARLKGLALVGAIGFLLIVSLTVSAALAAITDWLGSFLPDLAALLWLTNALTALAVFTLLFALVFRVLPDTRIPWRDLWFGAGVTALLFILGKVLIGIYLGTAGVASAYGAAGSFVLVLMWVYYSASIFLLGAEITRAYSEREGSRAASRRRSRAPHDGVNAVRA